MNTSENNSVARESLRVIISKSCLNSTGHYASMNEVRDIFDRRTHVPTGAPQVAKKKKKKKKKGALGSVIVSKLDLQTYTSEFESHCVPHSYGLVPYLSKKA